MHILYIVQYFNGPGEPGGSRPYQFARQWARKGHRVTVLTGNLNHKTLSPVGERGDQYQDGVRVLRLRTYNRIRGSFARRTLNFLSFAAAAWRAGRRIPDFDLVYASSTPLTTGIPGWRLSQLRRKPFYFEVRDLWPESAVVAGVLQNRALIRAAETLERKLYRQADRLVALTEGIRDGLIAKGAAPDRVLLVPNGVDDWMLRAQPQTPPGFPVAEDRVVCTYLGAHGRWNKVETILEAAARLTDVPVQFLLIGDGDHKPQLQKYARELRLSNLIFHDPVPKRDILNYLSRSQLALICTWDHPFQEMVLANKIFDYMAAACPIVAAARGEIPRLLQRADCGWSVEPEDPAALAGLIRELARKPADILKAKGCNGRSYAIDHYLRPALADRLEESFRALVPIEKEFAHGVPRNGDSAVIGRNHTQSGVSLQSPRAGAEVAGTRFHRDDSAGVRPGAAVSDPNS